MKTQAGSLLATYTYDGAGVRVKKVAGSTTTRYIFSGTKVMAEYVNGAAPASPTREYVYGGSQLLATLEGSTTTYQHPDQLSVRVNTNSSGTVVGQQGNYPFGEAWYSSSTTTKWRFTTYERDNESGLDYAMFRYDSNRLGRFLTPDPLAGSLANPQSLNRYAYVLDDPANLVDPLGLECEVNGSTMQCHFWYPAKERVFRHERSFCELNPSYCGARWWSPSLGIMNPLIGEDKQLFTEEERERLGEAVNQVSVSATVFIPVLPQFGLGISIPVTIIPRENLVCVGIGPGASIPPTRVVTGGLLTSGNTRDVAPIVSGWSASGSGNVTWWLGWQAIWQEPRNSVGGQAFSTSPGISASITYSGCTSLH